ncbi:MAG TPA: EAL domain-containing protein [Acidimicrobiales bacterium]|nr:EAL domain-containing protein [Acidimicrobiales bacterium]
MGATLDRTDTVLVVDDDPTVRTLLALTLGDAGLAVDQASTGSQALEMARTGGYSVVLLDNRMPGMTGMEVLAELRADGATRTLPVVIVTGEDEVGARVNGLQQGADDYIIKPFHPAELVARVRAQLRGTAAWGEVLERRLAERSAIAAALCRMHPETTAERTADALCSAMRELRDLAGVAIVVFAAGGGAIPLSVRGTAPLGVCPDAAMAPGDAALLWANARNGPWVDPGSRVAWAPFGPAGRPVGALALVADADRAGGPPTAELLATGIDFAAVVGGLVTPALLAGGGHDARAELSEVLRRNAFAPVFQPIVSLSDGTVIGFEALTRFTDGVEPQARFAEAVALDQGLDLERATLAAAMRATGGLPGGCWVSINVSPSLVLEGRALRRLVDACPATVVLELTEHDPVDDYARLSKALDGLRPRARLSVDDAGSGFASLRHVVLLEPDFVKLDQSWVTGIHADPARQALVAGLSHFADQTGAILIAEGIETDEERDALARLDVDLGQGFLFGRPEPVGSAA